MPEQGLSQSEHGAVSIHSGVVEALKDNVDFAACIESGASEVVIRSVAHTITREAVNQILAERSGTLAVEDQQTPSYRLPGYD